MLNRRGWRADTGRRNLTGEKMLMLLSESKVLNPWPRYTFLSDPHLLSCRAARAEVRQCGWNAVCIFSAEERVGWLCSSEHPVTFGMVGKREYLTL